LPTLAARAELLLGQADVAAVSRQIYPALFYDAQLDIKAMGAAITGWKGRVR
jgi:hypothetical protein